MGEEEGVIKYRLEFHEAAPLSGLDYGGLTTWHRRFKSAGILGQDPERYDGYGFGNISRRLKGGSFLISGTQTGHLDVLGRGDYALVKHTDIAANTVIAEGAVKPSSEALSHAAIYALSPGIQFVFHVHAPKLWQARERLGLPTTNALVPYGTPQMAREIKRLYEEGPLQNGNLMAMAGHEDGIIGFGASADEAGEGIMKAMDAIRQA